MLITEAIPAPTFANHETFHLHHAWLKKSQLAIKKDPLVFTSSEALTRLGVGKNMVKSMRSWSIASKILEPAGKPRDPSLRMTEMGDIIFGDDGLDPYLIKKQTLWLVHWLLLAPPCRIPVWWMILNDFPATNVSVPEMTESIYNRIVNIPEWKTPTPKSVKKDVDVFLHTYMKRKDRTPTEDYRDCPLRKINLIDSGRDSDSFRFVRIKRGISPHIVAFACLDFADRLDTAASGISVTRLAGEAGGIGNTFKMSARDIADMLREACNGAKLSKIADVNGAQHLTFKDPKKASHEMLRLAYGVKKLPESPSARKGRRS
ncbi:MAG: DUF4007 family protein [Alphaproteobacteria bacterium]|nr:DUF4007 family protein [Alphaproteobacteria bacterium]